MAILAYHKIGVPTPGGWESWNYVPEATFVGHLNYLRQHRWTVIDHATFLRGLAEPDSLPDRSALLTFDDGYRSMLTVTLPLLLQFGYPAVVFVPTEFIGRHNAFDKGVEPQEAICDWDELQQLERHGISVQSHGVAHRPFSQLGSNEQQDEFVRSKAELEAGLRTPVELFAYPYGDGGVDPQAMSQALKGAGYRAACLYGGGPVRLPTSDPYSLSRLAMGPDSDLQSALSARQKNRRGGGRR